MSAIYGLNGGQHDAASCLIIDGEIVACIEEERMTRIKSGNNYFSVPRLSTAKIQEIYGVGPTDCDHLVFASEIPGKYIKKELKPDKFDVYDHHDCHAATAYYTSGFQEPTLIVTLDGGGVDDSLGVYLGKNGEMNRVLKDKFYLNAQIAQLWGYSLHGIKGFDAEKGGFVWKFCKDEGKLMGMAPDGYYDERVYNILRKAVNYSNLQFFPQDTIGLARLISESMRRMGYFDTDEGIAVYAHNLQKLTEDLVLEFLDDLHKLYPEYTKVAFAGGVFANVKVNQKVNQLDWVDEIYVFPAMGDNGLGTGAAILKCRELGEGFQMPVRLKNVHLGVSYTNEEVEEFASNYDFKRKPYIPSEVAEYLNDGEIIGWFKGRFEFGPRALGARSILVRPTDYDTHKELNSRLKRYDTMPFAPIVMKEYFNEIFVEEKSQYTAEFMTLCYDTKDEWIERIPAVIQKSDKTARPQVVTQEGVPMLWEILEEYRKLSDIPVLLNTSFNAHNEPIIDSPEHAFVHLNNGIIDKLVIEDYVYYR